MDHLKVPITIAYYTGMRLREIIGDRGIRWDQVELSEQFGCIRIAAKQTKTKQPRVIYVIYMPGDFLRAMLKAKEVQVRSMIYGGPESGTSFVPVSRRPLP